MQSDFHDWSELKKEAYQILEHKILGIDTILQLIIKPSSEDNFRIDLIRNSNNTFRFEKLKWKKELDHSNLNDPLNKIKLFGEYKPTFERESIMLGENSKITLEHLIEKLVQNEKEFTKVEKAVVLEGIEHELSVKFQDKEIRTHWNIMPKHWKIIPTLTELILDLSGSK